MGSVEEEKVPYQGMKPQKPGVALLPERVRKAEGVRCDCTCDRNKVLSFMEFAFDNRRK